MAAPIKLGIAGVGGRMGRMLLSAAAANPAYQVCAALVRSDSAWRDRDIGELEPQWRGVLAQSDASVLEKCNILIDFTRPECTMKHLQWCVEKRVGLVIGTTGFNDSQKAAIEAAAEHVGIVLAPNMSVGVNVALGLVAKATQILGESYDVSIFEAHHKNKVDAPSGTALGLGEAVAAVRGQVLNEARYDAQTVSGALPPGRIGFASVRAGDIVGEHTVFFCGDGERLEVTHRATSRKPFADGALRAAGFLAGRNRGLFNMQQVLGLS